MAMARPWLTFLAPREISCWLAACACLMAMFFADSGFQLLTVMSCDTVRSVKHRRLGLEPQASAMASSEVGGDNVAQGAGQFVTVNMKGVNQCRWGNFLRFARLSLPVFDLLTCRLPLGTTILVRWHGQVTLVFTFIKLRPKLVCVTRPQIHGSLHLRWIWDLDARTWRLREAL